MMIQAKTFSKLLLAAVAASVALSVPAEAQRDPAYEAARQAGQIGEKMDGYLGVVGSAPKAVQDLVADLNIRRRANYTERAQAARPPATLQEYAFTQGCILIGRLENGLKYQAPDGSWKTKNGPAERDPRCPAA